MLSESFWLDLALNGEADPTEGQEAASHWAWGVFFYYKDDSPDLMGLVSPASSGSPYKALS